MLTSKDAGIDLHVAYTKIVERADMPNILVVDAQFISGGVFALVPTTRMMFRYNDWVVSGMRELGASKLSILNVNLNINPRPRGLYLYKVFKSYRFEFEITKIAEIEPEKTTHLRKFSNLITDDV